MESLEQLLEELSEFKPVSAGLVQSAKTELNNHMVDYYGIKRNFTELKRENESLNDKIESLERELESAKGKLAEFKDVAKHSSSMCVEIGGNYLFNMTHVGYDIEGAMIEKLEYNKNRADHKRENRAKKNGKKF